MSGLRFFFNRKGGCYELVNTKQARCLTTDQAVG